MFAVFLPDAFSSEQFVYRGNKYLIGDIMSWQSYTWKLSGYKVTSNIHLLVVKTLQWTTKHVIEPDGNQYKLLFTIRSIPRVLVDRWTN